MKQIAASHAQYAAPRRVSPLRILRTGRGLSQVALSELAGVDRSTISRAEHGLGEPFRSTRVRIAEVLGYPVHVVFPPEKEG